MFLFKVLCLEGLGCIRALLLVGGYRLVLFWVLAELTFSDVCSLLQVDGRLTSNSRHPYSRMPRPELHGGKRKEALSR